MVFRLSGVFPFEKETGECAMNKNHHGKQVERQISTSELIDRVATECGLTKHAAGQVIKSVFNALSEALAANEKVQLAGFGTFSPVRRPSRNIRPPTNPQTRELAQIQAGKAIRFNAGTVFMETGHSPH